MLIAGGGIAGLTLALSCHQIGVKAIVFESAAEMKPLGVGINLQPNATRELIALGFEEALNDIGIETEEYGFYTKHGHEIWVEPRGRFVGYNWPQFSVHRGKLQMLLYHAAVERLGPDAIRTGCRAVGFENHGQTIDLLFRSGNNRDSADADVERVSGTVLVGADGLHSAIRAKMVPDDGPPNWGGAILWRGATRAKPFRGGASMALIGHATQRFVTYPISQTDPDTGEATMNWLAELTVDPTQQMQDTTWNQRATADDFLSEFTDWRFDWIDIPEMVRRTDEIFVYQMVDRDPLDRWTYGRATLIGDAAHVMYPVGSNGASQSIVDGRKLARSFLDNGVGETALLEYENELRPATARLVLANRGQGPDYVMQLVEDRSGGVYDNVSDVVSTEELAAHAAKYKGVAGLSIDQLNASPPILPG